LGAWAWEEVAAELTAAGHRAVPVTLGTAVGDGVSEHIAQVGEVLAGEAEPVVLVGHSYGAFAAMGAADRWPARVARTVLIDAPVPEDGEALADLIPCEQRRTLVGELLAYPEQAWMPSPDLSPELAERIRERAPQWPVRSMTEPIRLTGAVKKVPMSGVFCTLSGADLALVRGLYASGAERFRWLAEPGNRYFELATGHCPMLSAPVELARTLALAAAGEGEPLLP
jgi:pimeloyl-ACP methyl ester carboxylesterase